MDNQLTPRLRPSLAALFLLALPLSLLAPAPAGAAPQRARAKAPAKAKAPTQTTEQPTCTGEVFKAPDAAINLSWREKSEHRLAIASEDRKAHTMRVRLGDFALRDAAGQPLTASDYIKVEPETATVPETASVPLLVRVEKPPTVRPGVYVGSLVLSEDGAGAKGCAKRIGVQLTVADAAPLSDKLTLRAYRLVPFTPLWYYPGHNIPLKAPLDVRTTALSKDLPLGGIHNKEGGTVAVYWTGQPSTSRDGLPLLPVSLSGLGPAGPYEGQLRLGPPADGAAQVNLTLDASDIAIWPILVIALSTWLGLCAQRYLNVRRPVWRLREQEAALGVAFDASVKRFEEMTRNTASATYSIADDFKRRREALRQKIGELQAGAALTLDTAADPYKAILEEFKQLRQAAAAWAGFADALGALREATTQDPGPPPQGYEGPTPAIMLWGGGLLTGRALTVDEFTERAAQVREATAAARLWLGLRDKVAEYQTRAGRLRASADGMTQQQRDSLHTAESDLRTARLRLWRANSTAALNGLTDEGGPLKTAETALEQLEANVAVMPAAVVAARSASARASLGALRRSFARESAAPDEEPADDRERQRFYAVAVRRWDVALTVLAFVIATLTALHNNYFGKSFGSLRDYVGLVMLGLGTKLAVDTLGSALGWLFGGRAVQQLRERAHREGAL